MADMSSDAPNRAAGKRRKSLDRQIEDELQRRIVSGQYDEEGLPPERVLIEEFGVSRHTIRLAMQRLTQGGLIERRAGAGTLVSRKGRLGFWAIGSLQELTGDFSVDQYLTLSAELVPARRFPHAAALFDVRKEGQLFHILRILTAQGLPYAICNIFASAEAGRAIPSAEIGAKPLIELVEQYLRVKPMRARQLASAAAADEQTARQLAVPFGAAMLVLHRTYFDADGAHLVHSELLCRPDRYQQVIDFGHEDFRTQVQ